MRIVLASLSAAALLAGCASVQPPAVKLEKANVLPLALDDDFEFRKQKLAFLSPEDLPPNQSEPVLFERQRAFWGAIDNVDIQQRYGNYFTFFWRAKRQADLTVRLEYRQAGLGNYVLAQELYYPAARGSYESRFKVTGDDYLEFGRVTAWRVLLISEGRIVGLAQSFIWK